MPHFNARGEPVHYRVGGARVGACLYFPELKAPQPALLFLHDCQGVDAQSLGVAERYARVGYVTLAVDLFGGDPPAPHCAGDLPAPGLNDDEVLAHLDAALGWLRTHPRVRGESVGVVGIGMGGSYAHLLAAFGNGVRAAVSFYGDPRATTARAAYVGAPILGLYAGKDEKVPVAAVERLRAALTAAGKPHELIVYADARHGFFDERSLAFDFESAEDAWSRSNKFCYRYLGEPG